MFCYGIYCWYQSVFIFFTSWCDSFQGSSVCNPPLWIVKLRIRSMSLSSSSRNLHNMLVPGQFVQWCIIHSQFDGSHTTALTGSLYVASQFRASTNKIVFWWVVQTHTKCVPDEPAMTHHLQWTVQNLENQIFTPRVL